MIERIDVLGILVSVVLLLTVFELVRRRHLREEYSFVWLLSSAALLAISLRRDLLERAASWLGVHYPPSLLFLALLVSVFVAALSASVALSRQRRQIDRLIEDVAILEAEFAELKRAVERSSRGDATRSITSAQVIPDASGDSTETPQERPAAATRMRIVQQHDRHGSR